MLYVDTGVLVALCTREAKTASVLAWYEHCPQELASAAWCVTEFASALGLKQRTGQLNAEQTQAAWARFERICANDLQLLPVAATTFHKAALMCLTADAGLRAGDALHLACALEAEAQGLVTLDAVLAKNGLHHQIPAVPL